MKKGQLRIQEMSFMLVAVIIFFAMVGLFGIMILRSNLQGSVDIIQEKKVLSTLNFLANSPELKCNDKNNCVDLYKLIGLMDNSNYENFWPFSSLSVVRYSGFNKSVLRNCVGDMSDDCDRIVVYDKDIVNEKKISNFVILCWTEYEDYYTYEKCEIAKIVAGREI